MIFFVIEYQFIGEKWTNWIFIIQRFFVLIILIYLLFIITILRHDNFFVDYNRYISRLETHI